MSANWWEAAPLVNEPTPEPAKKKKEQNWWDEAPLLGEATAAPETAPAPQRSAGFGPLALLKESLPAVKQELTSIFTPETVQGVGTNIPLTTELSILSSNLETIDESALNPEQKRQAQARKTAQKTGFFAPVSRDFTGYSRSRSWRWRRASVAPPSSAIQASRNKEAGRARDAAGKTPGAISAPVIQARRYQADMPGKAANHRSGASAGPGTIIAIDCAKAKVMAAISGPIMARVTVATRAAKSPSTSNSLQHASSVPVASSGNSAPGSASRAPSMAA